MKKMAVTVILFWVSFVGAITGSNAANNFNVLYTPDSLKFLGSSTTSESVFTEIICACLGLSVHEDTLWRGLFVTDPFNTPEAVVEVWLEGVSNISVSANHPTFPLTVENNEREVFEAVKSKIKQRGMTTGNKLLDVNLSDPNELTTEDFKSVFGEIKVSNVSQLSKCSLNYSVDQDHRFLKELETLKAITAKVSSGSIVHDNVVDLYNFRFSSMRDLSYIYGPNSTQASEAKELLDKALQELSKAFVKAYEGSVLVTIITDITQNRRPIRSPDYYSKQHKSRRAKLIDYESDEKDGTDHATIVEITPPPPPLQQSKNPVAAQLGASATARGGDSGDDEDFAIMFHIMLWFGVVYIFALLAIVYGTMEMDPGRDTIIYRMTAPRGKKEL